MKTKRISIISLIAFILFIGTNAMAQTDTTQKDGSKIYIIHTYDGGEFMGEIISQDSKEVLINTKDRGEISIPKYQIKEMREVEKGEVSAKGEYIPEQLFASRYFLSTNGLPMKKGDNYIKWSFIGPDFQFGVSDNFGVGVMTTWVGIPIIASAKYSFRLADKVNMGVGTLLGTGTWAAPDFGLAVPFTALTFGGRRANLNFSAGYGAVFADGESEGRSLLSVAGITQINRNISLVFDSFIVPPTSNSIGGAWLIPGIRYQIEDKQAFQFGFGAMIIDGDILPVPLPALNWYRKL